MRVCVCAGIVDDEQQHQESIWHYTKELHKKAVAVHISQINETRQWTV
jgi:hypothetical protein